MGWAPVGDGGDTDYDVSSLEPLARRMMHFTGCLHWDKLGHGGS